MLIRAVGADGNTIETQARLIAITQEHKQADCHNTGTQAGQLQ